MLAMWTAPPIQDGRSYICAGLRAGLNLSLSMIQEDYVTAAVGQKLLSGKLGQA
jgi:transcriptional regulator GlxA family with amidase domain